MHIKRRLGQSFGYTHQFYVGPKFSHEAAETVTRYVIYKLYNE